jgi:hypothetical protein
MNGLGFQKKFKPASVSDIYSTKRKHAQKRKPARSFLPPEGRLGLPRARRSPMDNQTKSDVRRYITLAAINILSEQATEESEHVRIRELCHILTAVLLQRLQQTTRMDHILRSLSTERAQHPAIRKVALQLDEVFTNLRDDIIENLVGDLKHPENSKLNIPLPERFLEKRKAKEHPTKPVKPSKH